MAGIFNHNRRTWNHPTSARPAAAAATPVAATPATRQAPQVTLGSDSVTLSGQRGSATASATPAGAGKTTLGLAVQGQGAVKGTPVAVAAGTKVTVGAEGVTGSSTIVAGSSPTKGGVSGSVAVQTGTAAAGAKPGLSAELSIGNDVLAIVRQEAYQKTRAAIRNRQVPDVDVPKEAMDALKKVGAMNADGSLNGAVTVNLDDRRLVDAVRQGVTQGIKDQPFRNRGLIRPQGMHRLRAAIAESRPVQNAIVRTVGNGMSQVKGQVAAASNGVVRFNNAPVTRTGMAVQYNAAGVSVRGEVGVGDVSRFIK